MFRRCRVAVRLREHVSQTGAGTGCPAVSSFLTGHTQPAEEQKPAPQPEAQACTVGPGVGPRVGIAEGVVGAEDGAELGVPVGAADGAGLGIAVVGLLVG
jgi:hypothetical protein